MILLDDGKESGNPTHEFVTGYDGEEYMVLNSRHPNIRHTTDKMHERDKALEQALIELAKEFGAHAVSSAARELPNVFRVADEHEAA